VADATFRLRVTYGKTGRLRFLAHLEVLHACERSVRRAGLEYAVTHGFTPRMKVAFGPALPVGTEGRAESYDLWLTRFVPPDTALETLRGVSPEGLTPVGASYIPEREPSLAAAMTLAGYEVARGSLELVHKGKDKVYDLELCLPEGTRVTGETGRATARFTVRMGPWGSLRPETLVSEALRSSGLDGAVTYVTRVSLRSEEVSA
jgi:hypothetical protein